MISLRISQMKPTMGSPRSSLQVPYFYCEFDSTSSSASASLKITPILISQLGLIPSRRQVDVLLPSKSVLDSVLRSGAQINLRMAPFRCVFTVGRPVGACRTWTAKTALVLGQAQVPAMTCQRASTSSSDTKSDWEMARHNSVPRR